MAVVNLKQTDVAIELVEDPPAPPLVVLVYGSQERERRLLPVDEEQELVSGKKITAEEDVLISLCLGKWGNSYIIA